MVYSISCINPEEYNKYSIEEYNKLIADRDEYALDASRFMHYSMDLQFVYLPKANKYMELEFEEEYAEYETEKLIEEIY